MTPAPYHELIRALEDLCRRFPHWRFGQLVCNVAGWADVDVWDVEDDQLLQAIRQQDEYQRSAQPTDESSKPASA